MHLFYHEMAESDYRPLASTRTQNMGSLPPTNEQHVTAYTNEQHVTAYKCTGDTEGNASKPQPPIIPRNDARLHKRTDDLPGFDARFLFQMTVVFWGSQRVIYLIFFDVSEGHTAAASPNSYGFNSRSGLQLASLYQLWQTCRTKITKYRIHSRNLRPPRILHTLIFKA
jgi:hypothetical protein